MSAAKILIVDDHPLTAEGLSLAARAALPGVQIVSARTIADAADAMDRRQSFRLVVLDFNLPDSRGYAGMLRLQQLDPEVPIAIVTAYEEQHLIEAAKALGAAGFISKSLAIDAIATILRHMLAGATYFPEGVTADRGIEAARARIKNLSRAQYAVLMALADGRSNKAIAYDLSITEATVKVHMTAILRKLGVTNRSQALLAIRPLLQPPHATATTFQEQSRS